MCKRADDIFPVPCRNIDESQENKGIARRNGIRQGISLDNQDT